jgi:hypothetical protein
MSHASDSPAAEACARGDCPSPVLELLHKDSVGCEELATGRRFGAR